MAAGHSYDVAIAGGGVMGCAAAWWLSHLAQDRIRVLVVERDPGYTRAATALSVASIRQQFTQPINVRISRFGLDFIRSIRDFIPLDGISHALDLRENGYLFLAGSAGTADAMRRAAAMQRALGAATELLDRAGIAARFPWLVPDDIVLGSFGPRDEGWFDNMGLLSAFRRGARAAGVDFVADRVVALRSRAGRIAGVSLASGRSVDAGAVVNAAGTGAVDLLRTADQDIPVESRKRTVFLIDAPNALARDAPLLVDHSGFYLRPEGRQSICASVPAADAAVAPDDFEPEHGQFEDFVWPRLYARAPCFDAVKVTGAWAGHYDFNTFDQNAIVGPVPGVDGLYLMNGFSGHGLQQAPALGRGIAEHILHGGYRTLDLAALGMDRIAAGRPVVEDAIV